MLKRALAAAAATGLLLTAAPAAHAETYTVDCWAFDDGTGCYGQSVATSGLELAARARYSDESDKICALDRQRDGRSAVTVYWKKGHPDQKKRLWNPNGDGSTTCRSLGHLPENARYVMKACTGEYATKPANRVIISCGPTKGFML